MKKNWQRYLPYLLFPLFFVFVSISNIFDWDHFFGAAESDLRSWMIWHEAPVWSYQFCGGVTRLGDPQAFGLSPFFILHVLFGVVWGWKILVVLSLLVAVFYLERLRAEFFPAAPENISRLLIFAYAFGNFFLWHFHHGHMTFLLHLWVVALVYYYLRAVTGRFVMRDFAISTAIVFAIFSSGFYHTSIFFGVPLALSCLIHLGWGMAKRKLKVQAFLKFAAALGLGLVLSSYKWLGVLHYQMNRPRTVSTVEITHGLDALSNLFLPTINYLFLGKFNGHTVFSIWEYSIFSWVNWILIVLVFTSRKPLLKAVRKIEYPALLPLILLFVTLLLYVGGDNTLYPYYWINHFLFRDSIRVVGRFGHNFVFAGLLLNLYFFSKVQNRVTRFLNSKTAFYGGTVLIALNLLSFSPTLYHPLTPNLLTSVVSDVQPEMRQVFFTRNRTDRQSFMYEPIAAGLVVLNCYNPIARDQFISLEFSDFVDKHQSKPFPFIDFDSRPSEACLRGTYMTSNTIQVAAECPRGCFTVNDLSVLDQKKFVFDPKNKIYCTK